MVLIGTPAYGGMNHIDYTKSIIEYSRSGVNFAWLAIGNESLITRARNTVLSHFYHHNKDENVAPELKYTHLLYLDADIYYPVQGFKRLFESGYDVCGAPVRLKSDNLIFNVNDVEDVNDEWMNVSRLGTAVMMLSKKVIDKLVENAIEKGDVYDGRSSAQAGDKPENKYYEVFKTGIIDEIYHSEDYFLCNEVRKLGYKIWVDKTIKTVHYGTIPFST